MAFRLNGRKGGPYRNGYKVGSGGCGCGKEVAEAHQFHDSVSVKVGRRISPTIFGYFGNNSGIHVYSDLFH